MIVFLKHTKKIGDIIIVGESVFFFEGGCTKLAYRILVPHPGIKPVPLAVDVPRLNYWMSMEVLG